MIVLCHFYAAGPFFCSKEEKNKAPHGRFCKSPPQYQNFSFEILSQMDWFRDTFVTLIWIFPSLGVSLFSHKCDFLRLFAFLLCEDGLAFNADVIVSMCLFIRERKRAEQY